MSCTPIQDFSLITLNDAGKAGTPGKLYSIVPSTGDGDFDVTRAGSAATRVNEQGIIETVPAGMPRIDFDPVTGEYLGTLVEPQKVNGIRNPIMSGAVVGVIGSGGALPTNWGLADRGLSHEVVAIGVEKGIPYIDIRFFGTSNVTGSVDLYEDGAGARTLTAFQGEVFNHSVFLKTIAEPQPPNSNRLGLISRPTGSGAVFSFSSELTLTNQLKRYNAPLTATFVDATHAEPLISFPVTNGQSYDFTIRIGAPQFERGANMTSVIIPASIGATTRDADVITRTGASALIGQTSGVIECDINLTKFTGGLRGLLTISDGTANNRLTPVITASNQLGFFIIANGTSIQAGATVAGSQFVLGLNKLRIEYDNTGYLCTLNGNVLPKITSGVPNNVPIGMSIISLGSLLGGSFLQDYIKLTALKTSL